MKVLIRDSMKDVPLIGKPGLRTPIVGIVVEKELNPNLPEKFIDPNPDKWDEALKKNEIILKVPMDQWKGEPINEYVLEFMKREGIV
jgi:hypothetical protein